MQVQVSTAAQLPGFDSTKKVRGVAADTAVGLTPGHSENDEPCNEPEITRKLGIVAGREPESSRKQGIFAGPEITRKLGILLQKSVRCIQECFTVEPV